MNYHVVLVSHVNIYYIHQLENLVREGNGENLVRENVVIIFLLLFDIIQNLVISYIEGNEENLERQFRENLVISIIMSYVVYNCVIQRFYLIMYLMVRR